MSSLSHMDFGGKEADIIVTGDLSEQVGTGARIEISAKLGDLDV
jgi:hypothetical protein